MTHGIHVTSSIWIPSILKKSMNILILRLSVLLIHRYSLRQTQLSISSTVKIWRKMRSSSIMTSLSLSFLSTVNFWTKQIMQRCCPPAVTVCLAKPGSFFFLQALLQYLHSGAETPAKSICCLLIMPASTLLLSTLRKKNMRNISFHPSSSGSPFR